MWGTGQTGQSDEIHSLEAGASRVVSRIWPKARSISGGLDGGDLLLAQMRPAWGP